MSEQGLDLNQIGRHFPSMVLFAKDVEFRQQVRCKSPVDPIVYSIESKACMQSTHRHRHSAITLGQYLGSHSACGFIDVCTPSFLPFCKHDPNTGTTYLHHMPASLTWGLHSISPQGHTQCPQMKDRPIKKTKCLPSVARYLRSFLTRHVTPEVKGAVTSAEVGLRFHKGLC